MSGAGGPPASGVDLEIGPDRPHRIDRVERAGWVLLGALLLALLAGVLLFDRTGRPGLVGDEATYAMQAASLAWDGDLAYAREDYDRFVRDWGGPPDGLILQSRDGGAHMTYGKPPLYALWAAPFARLAPVRGPLVANVLALALAAVLAARALSDRLGAAAPAWVAVLVFASVAFGYAYWVHADLFLMAAVASGYALVYSAAGAGLRDRGRDRELPQIWEDPGELPVRPILLRYLVAGALVAIAGAYRPFYLALLAPLALATPRPRRRVALAGLVLGALLLLGGTAALQWAQGGSISGYGGERQGFYPRTGYPLVDFPASAWHETIRTWGNTSWTQEGAIAPSFDPRLWAFNTLYFLVGQNVGVVPYFLPVLLGFAVFSRDRGRWAIPLAVLAAVACLLAIRPFNFYGGGGALGDRYFLPLYPALWFVAGAPARARTALAAAALAAPFLLPLWRHPSAFPIAADGRYAYVSPAARRLLPYETTQSHIPGGQDLSAHGLWIKFLAGPAGSSGSSDSRAGGAWIDGDGPAEILVGSPRPLRTVQIELDRRAPSTIEIRGGKVGERIFRPDGGIAFFVELDRPRARHPMWWTTDTWTLYRLAVRLPSGKGRIGFAIRPAEDEPGQEQKGPIIIRRHQG